jgi:hypothetical protein
VAAGGRDRQADADHGQSAHTADRGRVIVREALLLSARS